MYHTWFGRMTLGYLFLTVVLPLVAAGPELTPATFEAKRRLIKPQAGESRWQDVSWLLSVHQARQQAAAEGKPILVWSGGGCPPLGTC